MQTTRFETENADEIAAFLAHIERNHAGFAANIGVFDGNSARIGALEKAGYILAEDAEDYRLGRESFVDLAGGICERVTAGNFGGYAAFHDAAFPDIYWNSMRLNAALANWRVYVARESGKIARACFLTRYKNGFAEIFGLYAPHDTAPFLAAVIKELYGEFPQTPEIIFFVDAGEEQNKKAAQAVGFIKARDYKLYAKRL